MNAISLTVADKEPITVSDEIILSLIRSLYKKNSDIIIQAWQGLIRGSQKKAKPGQRLKKGSDTFRRPYADTLIPKLWTWPSNRGVSLIVGPEARSAPHAHLAEYGTGDRTRQPYMRGPRGKGHGVRGRYESVNFKGSKKHGRPPFEAGHPILKTGAARPRQWKAQAVASTADTFATAMAEGLAQGIIQIIQGN